PSRLCAEVPAGVNSRRPHPRSPRAERSSFVANSSPIRLSSDVLFGKACNRSLCAPLAHIEGSTYLRPRQPVTARCKHAVSVNLSARPSELLALGPRIAQPGLDALLDKRSLKLGHGTDDLKHQAAGGRAEVEVVAEADEGDSIGAKICERIDEVFQRTTEAINLPHEHGIELPPMGVGHELVQLRSRFL